MKHLEFEKGPSPHNETELAELRRRIGELEASDGEFKQAVDDLRESEGRLHQILESTPVPTLVIDADHQVTHWNRACENLTGIPSDRMVGGRDPWRAFYTEKRPILADIIVDGRADSDMARYYETYHRLNLIEDAYEAEGFYPNLGPDGKWLYFTAAPLMDGEGRRIGAIETVHDITDRKRSEEKINRLNADLAKSVEEIKASMALLRRTQGQLVESEKMALLGRLVGGVAHEVNTPVGVAVTAASLLGEKTQECRDRLAGNRLKRSDLREYLVLADESTDIVLANLRRAAEFIQSFKQVAVDQVSGEKRSFHLREYILDMVASLRPKLKNTDHTVTVHCDDDLALYSYPGVFSQIISNFIVNSLVHGFEETTAGEMVIEAEKEGDELVFRYSDNGKGIEPDKIDHIFEPFFTTRRGRGGDGLGLHIVHNLTAQRLGGSIVCDSAPGRGATFTIRVPMTPPPIATAPHQEQDDP